MYYISENKIDLENYNALVNEGENYSGTTQEWSAIVKHQEKELFAIIVNEKYIKELSTIENLNGWQLKELMK
jgi:hypothetical protein